MIKCPSLPRQRGRKVEMQDVCEEDLAGHCPARLGVCLEMKEEKNTKVRALGRCTVGVVRVVAVNASDGNTSMFELNYM
jgi:hypothetical protein